MAKDNNFARVLKTTLPPTITRNVCDIHTAALCSLPQPFAVKRPAHPPGRRDNFLNAAELKRRFQSHLITPQATKLSEGDGSVEHQNVATIRCLEMSTDCDNSQRFNSYLRVHHVHCKNVSIRSTFTCKHVSHQAFKGDLSHGNSSPPSTGLLLVPL